MEKLALFLHLIGAFVFVGGIVVSGAAYAHARRRDRAGDIALLLRVARTGVMMAAFGAALLVGCGFWLVAVGDHGFDERWLDAALGLFGAAAALGAIGGRRPRQARLLAARLADDQPPSRELRQLLDDRAAAKANYLGALLIVVIVALMVWKPGSH